MLHIGIWYFGINYQQIKIMIDDSLLVTNMHVNELMQKNMIRYDRYTIGAIDSKGRLLVETKNLNQSGQVSVLYFWIWTRRVQ